MLFTSISGVRQNELEAVNIPVYSFLLQEDLDGITGWQPDIVHVHSHGVTLDAFREIKKRCPDARYIETNVFARPSPWVDEIDISFQLSAWCEWLYKVRYGKLKYKTAIVPNPVDTQSFQRASGERIKEFRNKYGICKDDVLIGRVGQNSKYKWSCSFIDIFDKLRKSDDRLRLLVVNPPEMIKTRIAS